MYRHSEYRGACHCITKWGMLRRLQLQRNDLYGGRDRACRVFSARRAFISSHNGRTMPSLLAITDNGSERAVCKPACWASYCCLCKCQIPALELGPLLACLNQSSICAVESTWSSCLPLGKTVSSCKYSASHAASFGRCTKPFSIIAVCACMRMTLSDCG